MYEPSEKVKQAEKILTADSFSPEKAREAMFGLSQDELTWLSQCFMEHVYSFFYSRTIWILHCILKTMRTLKALQSIWKKGFTP